MILIAIGANSPGLDGTAPLLTCRAAVEALAGLAGLRLFGVSRWYVTAPVPPSGQPDFINGMARLEGEAEPSWLLARLGRIEVQAGRRRTAANAARPLDLDLIAVDAIVRDAPDPVLPHPRAHERAFVLRPLAELAPGWVHPRLGQSVETLLAALPPQRIELL